MSTTHRPIKFRVWDIGAGTMLNLDDIGLYFFEEVGIREWPKDNADRYILMQFTGLRDADGKEVYDGDILDFDAREWGAPDSRSAVSWCAKEAAWVFGGGIASDVSQWRRVVGNIYENPELLESES